MMMTLLFNRYNTQFIAMATLIGAISWVTLAQAQSPEAYQSAAADLQAGNLQSACQQYQQLHKANPQEASALYGLAVCARSKGETAKAVNVLKGLIQAHPTFAPAQLLMGELLDEQGQPQNANPYYQQYVQLAKQQGIPLPKTPSLRLRLRGMGN